MANKNTTAARRAGFPSMKAKKAAAADKNAGENLKVWGKSPATKGQPCPTAFGHSPHSKRKSAHVYPKKREAGE